VSNKNSEDGGSYLSPGEQGLEEFMTRLESEAPLAEGELEITEYWFTDYCVVEVTETPSGEIWGRTDRTASTNSTSTILPSTTP
jgi:hypothetical protein